jgi:hypothetical protein
MPTNAITGVVPGSVLSLDVKAITGDQMVAAMDDVGVDGAILEASVRLLSEAGHTANH